MPISSRLILRSIIDLLVPGLPGTIFLVISEGQKNYDVYSTIIPVTFHLSAVILPNHHINRRSYDRALS